MRIQYKQKFHSVGQGLFYSSSLHLNNNISATIIFDCGSKDIEIIKNKIDEYEKNDIDILILSHLHYDHVSGLDYLLRNNRKVKTVILPYLFLKERLLLQFLNYNRPEWYNTFLSNPYSYLNEKGNVEKVIVIKGDSENNEQPENLPEEFPPLNDDNINEKKIIIKLEDASESARETIGKKEGVQFDGKLFLKKDNGYILISNMYFSFFNYKINNNKKIIAFNKAITRIGITDTKSVLALLQKDKNRKLIETSYKILKKDLNITSLSAYQGFILPFSKRLRSIAIHSLNSFQHNCVNDLLYCDCDGFIDGHFHGRFGKNHKYKLYFDCICDLQKHCNCSKMIGTLLLGDIKLDYKMKKRKELFTHFKNLLPSVKLIQLSHHGAENGWNGDLIAKIPESCLYLATHGVTNTYHHPHKKVIIELAENSRKFISVTERNEYYNRLDFIISQSNNA